MFSKAPIKRFNENDTDTPGPNTYDPKIISGKGSGGGVSLSFKENRFSENSESTPGPGQYHVDKKSDRRKTISDRSIGTPGNFKVPRAISRPTSSARSRSSSTSNTGRNVWRQIFGHCSGKNRKKRNLDDSIKNSTVYDFRLSANNNFDGKKDLAAQIDSKDAEIRRSILQKTELEAKLEDQQKDVELINQKHLTALKVQEENFQRVEKENQELSRQKYDLEVRLEQHQTTINQDTEARAQLVELNEQLLSKVLDNSGTILSLQEGEKELDEKLQLAYKDLVSVKNGISLEIEKREAAEYERLQMKEKMEETNIHLQDTEDQITRMESQVGNLTNLNIELESQLASFNLENTNYLNEIAELQKKLETKCDELKEVKVATSKLKDVEMKLGRTEAENCCIKLDLVKKTEEFSSLREAINEKENMIGEYKKKTKVLENTNTSSLQKIADLQEELREKCDEIKDLKEAVSRLNDVEMKLKCNEAEICRTKLGLVKKAEEVSSLIQSLDEKQNMVGKFKNKIQALENMNSSLLKETADLQEKLNSKYDEFKQLKEATSTIQDLERNLKSLEKDLKGAEISLRSCQEMESLLKECRKDIKELRKKDMSNQKEIEIKDELIDNLSSKLDPLQEEVQVYKEKYETLCNLIEPFKEQLDNFEIEKAELLAKNKEAHGEVKKLATQYGKMLGHQNHKQKIQHLVTLKQENVDLKKENSRMRIELDKYKKFRLKSEPLSSHNKENSLLLSYTGNPSTPGAEKTPNIKRPMLKTPVRETQQLRFDVFSSSTPVRRQCSASPNLIRKRE